MLSTYQSYQFYASNLNQSLDRVKSTSTVSREMTYYRERISEIKTVDEFMEDSRVYNYAMKAYGLEDMAYAKAFIRKVLESDLSDPDSFANRLQDAKYKNLAAAYDFGNTQSAKQVQTADQTEHLIDTYDMTIAKIDTDLKEETRYYKAVVGTFKDVDDLFKNTRARDYVFRAFNIDPDNFNYDEVRTAISTSKDDLDTPVRREYLQKIIDWQAEQQEISLQRFNNKISQAERDKYKYLYDQYTKQIEKTNSFLELAFFFNFNPDGTLDPGVSAQDSDKIDELTERFVYKQPRLTATGAVMNQDYFEKNIVNVTKVDDILTDTRMRDIFKKSFGLPDLTSYPDLFTMLTENPEDPDSKFYEKGDRYIEIYKAFNFTETGDVEPGMLAQTEENTKKMMYHYIARYDDGYEKKEAEEAATYKRYILLTKDLDDLLTPAGPAKTVRDYALKANGIDPEEVSLFKLKKILTSDPYDPKSYVNSLKDERFVTLAKSFNFTADGDIGPPRYAQTEAEITRISRAYYTEMTRTDKDESTKKKAEDEVSYYRSQLQSLETVDELVSDPRLMKVLLTAEGLNPEEFDTKTLRKILISDLNDPDSFANQQEDIRYKKLAGSFNFNADGIIESKAVTGVQNQRGLEETSDLYLKQLLEEQAGEQNVGARLALYFQRMAPTVTSTYSIIADPAMAEFIRTALSIPAEAAGGSVDSQVALIERKFNVEDLRDPDKLEDLTRRFLAMHDLDQAASEPVLDLFSGNATMDFQTVVTLSNLRSGL